MESSILSEVDDTSILRTGLPTPLCPSSHLLPPRSGLERSDFVHWHRRDDRSSWRIGRLAGVKLTLSNNRMISAVVESPGGVSPPGAPRTVREPLDSYGS